MIALTRRYRFSASHRLHAASLSERENAELFGKCNNPYGHGHDYVLSVTVAGKVDEQTGLILSAETLDRLVDEHVLSLLSHRNLNRDVPRFADTVPTTENLALVIADFLNQAWPSEIEARLTRVHVQETDRNGFEVLLGVRRPAAIRDQENLAVHV